jgi:hypothetical protein
MRGNVLLMRTWRSTEFGMICEEERCRLEAGFDTVVNLASRGIRSSDSDGRLYSGVL